MNRTYTFAYNIPSSMRTAQRIYNGQALSLIIIPILAGDIWTFESLSSSPIHLHVF